MVNSCVKNCTLAPSAENGWEAHLGSGGAGDGARLRVELARVVEEARPGLVGRREGERRARALEREELRVGYGST
jgi:hypothetical protein